MDKKIINFGDTKLEKQKFQQPKNFTNTKTQMGVFQFPDFWLIHYKLKLS